jgi:hypothetical protein
VWTRATAAACALIVGLLIAPGARAELAIDAGSQVVTGPISFTKELFIPTPGALTVRVADLGVPFTIMDRLTSLSFSLTTSQSMVAMHDGPGELMLDVTGPGMYFLSIAATPAAKYQLGLVSWKATLVPLQAAVPLPAAIWLFLGGLAGIAGFLRKRPAPVAA